MPAGKLLTYFSAVKYKKRNFSLQKKWLFFPCETHLQPGFTCSKLAIETLANNNNTVNFEHISHICSSVSIVNFEHVIAGWD